MMAKIILIICRSLSLECSDIYIYIFFSSCHIILVPFSPARLWTPWELRSYLICFSVIIFYYNAWALSSISSIKLKFNTKLIIVLLNSATEWNWDIISMGDLSTFICVLNIDSVVVAIIHCLIMTLFNPLLFLVRLTIDKHGHVNPGEGMEFTFNSI